jgi:iron(III) transport system substrate-binding protein
MRTRWPFRVVLALVVLTLVGCSPARPSASDPTAQPAAPGQPAGQGDWDAVLAAARQEGRVVVSIPASAELRKDMEAAFEKRYPGIDLEPFAGRGTEAVQKIVSEAKGGIYYFDIHIGGTNSTLSLLKPEGLLVPLEPFFMLPEVKDPAQWWGGHLWADYEKQTLYAFQAYFTENIWVNTEHVRPDEIRSYDDLLDPKWRGRIGILDPRTAGAGDSFWAFLWKIKGEDYLNRLVQQNLMIGRNQQDLAAMLARGRVALMLGLTYYSFQPFFEAGAPIKPSANPAEGNYMTAGSGNLSVMKNYPHPNATKVFVNWLLSREGQQIFTEAMGQGTRRLDVSTTELMKTGVIAAKDVNLTVADWDRMENQSEQAIDEVREPAREVALKLLGR